MPEVEDNWHHTYGDVSGSGWEHPSHSKAGNSSDSPLPFLPSRALPDWGINNPRHPWAVPIPCPSAPFSTVQGTGSQHGELRQTKPGWGAAES